MSNSCRVWLSLIIVRNDDKSLSPRKNAARRRVAVAPSLAALAPSLAFEEPSPHPIAIAPRRPSPSCSRRAVALSIAVAPRRPSPPCSRRAVSCRARAFPCLQGAAAPLAPRRPSPSCSHRAVALSIAVALRRPSPPCSRRAVPCRARAFPCLQGAALMALSTHALERNGSRRPIGGGGGHGWRRPG
jgi:hypothetical protein